MYTEVKLELEAADIAGGTLAFDGDTVVLRMWMPGYGRYAHTLLPDVEIIFVHGALSALVAQLKNSPEGKRILEGGPRLECPAHPDTGESYGTCTCELAGKKP